jgi:hypothetical protein
MAPTTRSSTRSASCSTAIRGRCRRQVSSSPPLGGSAPSRGGGAVINREHRAVFSEQLQQRRRGRPRRRRRRCRTTVKPFRKTSIDALCRVQARSSASLHALVCDALTSRAR